MWDGFSECGKADPARGTRRIKEFFLLRRSFLDRKIHRFRAIHRAVGVTTALSRQGGQEALQSVNRLGFPKKDRPIFADTRAKLERRTDCKPRANNAILRG